MTVSPGSTSAVHSPPNKAPVSGSEGTSNGSAPSSPAGRDATAAKNHGELVSAKVQQVPEPESRGPEHLLPSYPNLINYPRLKGSALRCVMCGLESASQNDLASPGVCVIPRQNKDVCRDCDSSLWVHLETNALFKWCKGCKRFLGYSVFGEKVEAAKCERCRERGRRSYMARKRRASMDETLLDRPSPDCDSLTSPPTVEGGRSRAYSHSHLPSPDSESSIETDEMECADGIPQGQPQQKLSSLFGHPLKRVRVMEDPQSPRPSVPRPRAGSEATTQPPTTPSPSPSPPATTAADSEALEISNPLYDLVAVHHHIMTLEETADQVDILSKELASKTDQLFKYKAEVDELKQQLKLVQDQDQAHLVELSELRSKNELLHVQERAWRQREKQIEAEMSALLARQAPSPKRPHGSLPANNISTPEIQATPLKISRVV